MSEQARPKHSRFGGSVIARVIHCPGSVAFCANAPPKVETQYMAEGTLAHEFGQYMLENGERDAVRYIGEAFPFESAVLKKLHTLCGAKYQTVSKDMARAVQVYVDAVYEEMAAEVGAELFVEQSFTLPVGDGKEVYGANDALVYQPERKRLVVFDYKHGAGKDVDVEDNAQLKFYAAGAAIGKPWPIAEIELIIVQPRSPDALEDHGGVKRWTWDGGDLFEFLAEVDGAVNAAKGIETGEPGVPMFGLEPGPHCKSTWCPAAAICPAAQADKLKAVTLDYASVDLVMPSNLPEPRTMDPERIAKIMAGAAALKAWCGQVEEYAFNLANSGQPVPGFKLVDKVARRKWIDSDSAILDFLEMNGVDRKEAAPPTLGGITETEKLLRAAVGNAADFKVAKERMSLDFTIKDSSGLTLAPESDKREAVDAVARAFGSVTITPPPV